MAGHRGKVGITATYVNIDATLPTSLLANITLHKTPGWVPREQSVELGTLHISEVSITKYVLSATYYSCDPEQVSFLTRKMGWMSSLAHPSHRTRLSKRNRDRQRLG